MNGHLELLHYYWEINRKKPLLLPSGIATCSCKFSSFNTGSFVKTVQWLKFGLPAKTMFMEGTVQERFRFPIPVVKHTCGAGGDCEIQIPPPVGPRPGCSVPTSKLPSAEQANPTHDLGGTLLDGHVTPELVEV